ncbi:hypothetical protein ABZT43_39025 [Streptomyces sp. NPDC005349]|uniref:hypothetical protein n=1 Tax=Streptomyces sp. NPDC005349 TaxID=3157037 RepID=UPI0033A7BABC
MRLRSAARPASVGSRPVPPPSALDAGEIRRRLRRGAELKRELVDFVQEPRFERQVRGLLLGAADQHGGPREATVRLDESDVAAVLDRFALQHRLPGGRTVVEEFTVRRGPSLSGEDRALLLGWCTVVEGVFELLHRDGDGVVLHHLADDLAYRVHANVGRRAFTGLRPGAFTACRLVPLDTDQSVWQISGPLLKFPKDDGPELAGIVVQQITAAPQLLDRNPHLRERARQVQAEDRAAFLDLTGTDTVVLPPDEARELLQEHALRRHRQTCPGGDPTAEPSPEQLAALGAFSDDLVDCSTLGMIYDETEGLGCYADFGLVDDLFAEPGRRTKPEGRAALRRLRDYLNDDSVPPHVIQRLADRHPENADTVFRALLRKPSFSWARHGQALLRRRKKSWYGRETWPGVTVLGDRLSELVRSGLPQQRMGVPR